MGSFKEGYDATMKARVEAKEEQLRAEVAYKKAAFKRERIEAYSHAPHEDHAMNIATAACRLNLLYLDLEAEKGKNPPDIPENVLYVNERIAALWNGCDCGLRLEMVDGSVQAWHHKDCRVVRKDATWLRLLVAEYAKRGGYRHLKPVEPMSDEALEALLNREPNSDVPKD